MKIRRVWPRIRGSVYHVRKGEWYHRENSLRGVRAARRAGKRGIDIDLQMSKPCRPGDPRHCGDAHCIGHVVGTHWGQPLLKDGFRDPLRRIPKTARVRDLYIWEIRRLIAVDRGRVYRIQPIERLLRECAKRGVVAVLEPKGDRRFELVATWQPIVRYADLVGAHLAGYAIRDIDKDGDPDGARRAAAMRAAGIDAHPIH